MSAKSLDRACKEERDPKILKRMQAVRMVNIKMNKLGFTKRRACEVTAEELQMSESSIKNYILNYREYGVGGLYDRPKSGAPPIYDSDVIDAAIADLEQKGRVTPRLLAAKVQELQGGKRRMSVRHARRELRTRRMSPKKAQHANVAAAKPHAVYRWRLIVLPFVLALRTLGYTVAVGDEMIVGQDANGDAVYWSDIGVPVKVPYVGDHDKFSALGITTEPDRHGRARRCHVAAEKANTASFINLLDNALKAFGPLVVIVDRAGWHNSNELKKYLRSKKGKIIVILLPVGSSYMNAKEQDWKQTKLADFYSDYYSSIGKKETATIDYLDTKLNPNLDIWKYLIRSPYAYRGNTRRRRRHYGSQGALQYIINKYGGPKIVQHPFKIIEKYGPDYVCKV